MKKINIILLAIIILCMAIISPPPVKAISNGDLLLQNTNDIASLKDRIDKLEAANQLLQAKLNQQPATSLTIPAQQSVQAPAQLQQGVTSDSDLTQRVSTLETKVNSLDQNLYCLGQQFQKLIRKLKIVL